MAVVVNSVQVAKATSSKYDMYLLPRKELDKLTDALKSDEYIIFELDNPTDKSILEYMYALAFKGYCDNPSNPMIFHRILVVSGADNTLKYNIALQTSNSIRNSEDFNTRDWTFETITIDRSTEQGMDKLYQIYANVVTCSLFTGKRPTVCVPDDFEIPYILRLLADVRVFTKSEWSKLVEEVSKSNE